MGQNNVKIINIRFLQILLNFIKFQKIEKYIMLEERLLDTKRNLQKLVTQSGKSLEDILKYLSESQSSFVGILDEKSILQRFQSQKSEIENYKQKESKKKELFSLNKSDNYKQEEMEKNGQGRICLQKVMELIEQSILDLNRALTIIMENIVDQMVTKKIYKIRQNFRNLILNIFGIQQFSFYACFGEDRIEYQDFSSNFITELMQTDLKYQLLQKITQSIDPNFEFIDLADNADMAKLFDLKSNFERYKYYGVIVNASPEQQMKASYCLMIKTQNKQVFNCVFVKKLINKIIEISQINTSQESTYLTSKIYAKKMLDLLQITILQYESRLKHSLFSYCSLKKQLCYSITNIIKIILSKVDQNLGNQQPVFALKKLASQFEEIYYKKIEQIRIYKKYVRENDSILLEFNRIGVLQFISGNIDNQHLNNLTTVWEQGKPVLDLLFGKNEKFDNYVKKALRGTLKTERPIQLCDKVKAKITTNGKRITKISIILQNKQFENKNEQKEEKENQKTNNTNQNSKLLKRLQKQNPGVTREGWLDLFLKTGPKQRRDSSINKKNNTFISTNDQNEKSRKQLSMLVLKNQFKINLDDVIIEDPNINFLTFNEKQLQNFAIKVLNNLDYFQRLPQEKEKLQNFIKSLHDGYQIHSNPFHNFRHGINVMHACYLLSSLPANLNILTPKDVFVNVFSGLCHDVGHTGFTNAFQIASQSRKALIYNDRSPLQNFHASLTFQILRKSQNNFLCHMSKEQFAKFRKAVIQNILYTDIKEHFPLLNSFNDLLKSGKTLGHEDAPILSYMIVHSSDFSGSIKQFSLCKQWSRRVNLQFSNQYKVEGQIGLAQTPFMKDLDNPIVLSKAEGGFLKVIVYPLFQSLDNFYVSQGIVHKCKKNIENNIKSWQQINKSQTQKAKALKQKTEENPL